MKLPVDLASASVRNVLKEKWLKQTDLTRNWHYSNVMFMRLELVVDQLTQSRHRRSSAWWRTCGPPGRASVPDPASAGSGNTRTIAWTAHRLATLHDGSNAKVFGPPQRSPRPSAKHRG